MAAALASLVLSALATLRPRGATRPSAANLAGRARSAQRERAPFSRRGWPPCRPPPCRPLPALPPPAARCAATERARKQREPFGHSALRRAGSATSEGRKVARAPARQPHIALIQFAWKKKTSNWVACGKCGNGQASSSRVVSAACRAAPRGFPRPVWPPRAETTTVWPGVVPLLLPQVGRKVTGGTREDT